MRGCARGKRLRLTAAACLATRPSITVVSRAAVRAPIPAWSRSAMNSTRLKPRCGPRATPSQVDGLEVRQAAGRRADRGRHDRRVERVDVERHVHLRPARDQLQHGRHAVGVQVTCRHELDARREASAWSPARAEPIARWPTWMMRSTCAISDARRMVEERPNARPELLAPVDVRVDLQDRDGAGPRTPRASGSAPSRRRPASAARRRGRAACRRRPGCGRGWRRGRTRRCRRRRSRRPSRALRRRCDPPRSKSMCARLAAYAAAPARMAAGPLGSTRPPPRTAWPRRRR